MARPDPKVNLCPYDPILSVWIWGPFGSRVGLDLGTKVRKIDKMDGKTLRIQKVKIE